MKSFILSIINLLKFNFLEKSEKKIVFYSESGEDYHFFENIIKHIVKTNKKIYYLASDINDPVFDLGNKMIIPLYIGDGIARIILFQTVEADVFVLTMIDLHNHHLKRSKNPVHYVLIPHTMVSTHMVDQENVYDHYDTVCCVGPHQMQEIEKREQLYDLPPKKLLPCGYDRFDVLAVHRCDNNIKQRVKTVLIAPSWGKNALLETCGKELITLLLNEQYTVILRPHPQTIKLNSNLINELTRLFSEIPNFIFNPKMSSFDTLLEADVLVSDWSGIALEFGLALEKPVLYIDVPPKVKNPDYKKLSIEPVEIKFRNKLGKIVSTHDISKIDKILQETIIENARLDYNALRKEVLYNPGIGASITAQEIMKISGQLVD